MKTSLDFEGPADLSVGEIRISGHKGVETKWIATPGQRRFKSTDLDPGYYVAEISPAGAPPQSVVFEVKTGVANTVSVPEFAALAATGSGINFLDVTDRHEAVRWIYNFAPDDAPGGPDILFTPDPKLGEPETGARAILSEQRELATADKLISVGLSIERPGARESWDRFDGPCSAQVSGGCLSIEIGAPEGWTPESGRRVRMSVAIQGVRVERLLLPLYRGGTAVGISCSPLSPNDVTLEVLPVDPVIRAIWRALEAGTYEHAAAVRDHVLAMKGPQSITALGSADPWAAMLAGLLYLRFPEALGQLSHDWAEKLCRLYPWAADVFVIRARQLSNDAGDTLDKVLASAGRSIDLLSKAQARGSPYFNQSNQFFNELIESLAGFSELPPEAHDRVERARRRWQRELSLQRNAGVSFSWLSRDQRLLKEGILAPNRNPSGRLRARDCAIVFTGRLSGGTIVFEGRQSEAPKAAASEANLFKSAPTMQSASLSDRAAPLDCPALARPPGPSDDPNKGRFGGQAAAGGFRLSARFPNPGPKVTTVILQAELDEGSTPDIGESVWFCLHPTFNPEWVRVLFRGRAATLTVQAWGGFTVGAWIPTRKVELECDLAELPDAPRIIAEY